MQSSHIPQTCLTKTTTSCHNYSALDCKVGKYS